MTGLDRVGKRGKDRRRGEGGNGEAEAATRRQRQEGDRQFGGLHRAGGETPPGRGIPRPTRTRFRVLLGLSTNPVSSKHRELRRKADFHFFHSPSGARAPPAGAREDRFVARDSGGMDRTKAGDHVEMTSWRRRLATDPAKSTPAVGTSSGVSHGDGMAGRERWRGDRQHPATTSSVHPWPTPFFFLHSQSGEGPRRARMYMHTRSRALIACPECLPRATPKREANNACKPPAN